MPIVSSVLLAVIFILCVLFIQLASNVKRYKPALTESDDVFPLTDMPTISLCIPARNETHALEDCLSSVIDSDYPKLEIIVLDDCSQDHTSQIIRGFAQDGIRFVRGKEPSDGWLGKNNAYEVLAREARGKYLFFMSVDTRLEPRTLSRLVNYMQTNKLSMVSLLPCRMGSWKSSILFAPLRYFWQVILPLGLNTPTATSLWGVQSDNLAEIGGFSAYKDKIMIENILAKKFFSTSEYHFLLSTSSIKIWYAKKWSSQAETAIRLWYPLLKKNLFYSLCAIIAHLILFVAPVSTLIISTVYSSVLLIVLSLIAVLLGYSLYYFYLKQAQSGVQSVVCMLLLPAVAMQEIGLIILSYYRYKKGDVSWKGRNVCFPVLKRPQ